MYMSRIRSRNRSAPSKDNDYRRKKNGRQRRSWQGVY
jgi:hypothetical protein